MGRLHPTTKPAARITVAIAEKLVASARAAADDVAESPAKGNANNRSDSEDSSSLELSTIATRNRQSATANSGKKRQRADDTTITVADGVANAIEDEELASIRNSGSKKSAAHQRSSKARAANHPVITSQNISAFNSPQHSQQHNNNEDINLINRIGAASAVKVLSRGSRSKPATATMNNNDDDDVEEVPMPDAYYPLLLSPNRGNGGGRDNNIKATATSQIIIDNPIQTVVVPMPLSYDGMAGRPVLVKTAADGEVETTARRRKRYQQALLKQQQQQNQRQQGASVVVGDEALVNLTADELASVTFDGITMSATQFSHLAVSRSSTQQQQQHAANNTNGKRPRRRPVAKPIGWWSEPAKGLQFIDVSKNVFAASSGRSLISIIDEDCVCDDDLFDRNDDVVASVEGLGRRLEVPTFGGSRRQLKKHLPPNVVSSAAAPTIRSRSPSVKVIRARTPEDTKNDNTNIPLLWRSDVVVPMGNLMAIDCSQRFGAVKAATVGGHRKE